MKSRLCLAALALFCCTRARAQFVLNGDFESGNAGAQTATNWTASTVDGAGGWRATGGHPNGFFILNSNGDPNSNPTLTQNIPGLVPGLTYRITGDYIRSFTGGPTANEFGVQIDGNLFEFDLLDPSNWTSFDRTFTYTGTSNLLTLTGERHADNAPGVDNITIALAPEPASLFGLLFMAACGARRRR